MIDHEIRHASDDVMFAVANDNSGASNDFGQKSVVKRHDGRLAEILRNLHISLTRVARTIGIILLAVAATGCAKSAENSASVSPSPATRAVASPANALVADAGKPGSVPLDSAQADALRGVLARIPATRRARLRYAVATREDGHPVLVVYDGLGLPADGKPPAKKFEYVVFKPINLLGGETYDPIQNAVNAALPVPVERSGGPAPMREGKTGG